MFCSALTESKINDRRASWPLQEGPENLPEEATMTTTLEREPAHSNQETKLSKMPSFDVGMLMHERDRKRASHLFRTASIGKNAPVQKNASNDSSNDQEESLGNFEPDWTKFESVLASGKFSAVVDRT